MQQDEEAITNNLVDALWQFWRLWRRVSHPVRRGKITPEQYWLLMSLKHRGPLNIGELAERLGITSSSATIATKRLANMGLVRRYRHKDDERVVTVELTPAGLEILKRWENEQRESLASLLLPLTFEERVLLLELIQKVSHS